METSLFKRALRQCLQRTQRCPAPSCYSYYHTVLAQWR